jgi:low temperature requirement protein LtrA
VDESAVEREHRVSPLELFFDLVFVFAFTQVTRLWIEQPTWGGLPRGLLVVAVLWWVWASFAWLTNTADADAGVVTVVMLCAMAAQFLAALAVPEAFGAHRLVFGVAFFGVVAAFVVLYALVTKGNPEQLTAVARIAPAVVGGAGLVLAAAFVPASLRPLLWGIAFVVGFFGPLLGGLTGWRVEPAHFAERHQLIVIIALGESLGAIGFGARDSGLGHGGIVGAVLGLVIAASFWLAYFDFAARGLRRWLTRRRGINRVALARDAYTYAHRRVILFAFGMRTTPAEVGSTIATRPRPGCACSQTRAVGHQPRPDGARSSVLAGRARAALGGARPDRHLPGRGRAAVPRAPHRRRHPARGGRAAHHTRVGDPRRRERAHDRHLRADDGPPSAPRSPISFATTAERSSDAGPDP